MARRFFRHGELPLVILALLAQRPQSPYRLMHELARLFAPAYRPSPGSIYPAVEALESEGLICAEKRGRRRILRLTAVGRRALSHRQQQVAALELRTGVRLELGDRIDALLARFSARARLLSPFVDPEAVEEILDAAAEQIERTAVARNRAGAATPASRGSR